MATLSEANYPLVLDYPVSQEQEQQSLIPQQQNSSSSKQDDFPKSFVLYQRKYSFRSLSDDVPQDQLDPANPSNFEVDMYGSTFQWEMFARSFLISLFYASGVGMLISLLFRCFHSTFYRNYFLYTDSLYLRIIGITNLIFFLFGVSSLVKDQTMNGMVTFITQFCMTTVAVMGTALVEAYCHPKFVKMMKTVKLGHQSLSSTRFRIDYFWSSDLSAKVKSFEAQRKADGASKEEIRREKEKLIQDLQESEMTRAIQTTISKLKINMSLYYISFFEKTPENLFRKLKIKQDLPVVEKGDFLIHNEMTFEDNIMKAITDFERDVFDYRFCTKANQQDDKKAYAYTLAVDLLFNKKLKSSGTFYLIAITYFAPMFMVVFTGYALFLVNLDLLTGSTMLILFAMASLELLIEFLPYSNILFFIYQGINLMKSKYSYMKELQRLVSTERPIEEDESRKNSYPILNILDFRSLEAWARLRKIFMHLYDDKIRGIILALTPVIIFNLILMVGVLWIFFTPTSSLQIALKLVMSQWIVQGLCYLMTFLIFAYYAARVNAQFKPHRETLQINKQIVASLFTHYPDFIREISLEPATYIENEGMKFLRKEYGENITLEVERRMKKDCKKLLQTYDSILEELDREEAYNPIRILGIPMTSPFVKGLGAFLLSIATTLIKQALTSVFDHKTA